MQKYEWFETPPPLPCPMPTHGSKGLPLPNLVGVLPLYKEFLPEPPPEREKVVYSITWSALDYDPFYSR